MLAAGSQNPPHHLLHQQHRKPQHRLEVTGILRSPWDAKGLQTVRRGGEAHVRADRLTNQPPGDLVLPRLWLGTVVSGGPSLASGNQDLAGRGRNSP